jgi:di/tripeptidase
MKEKLLERFLRYISIDTQSDPNSTTFPSTEKQFNLAKPAGRRTERTWPERCSCG